MSLNLNTSISDWVASKNLPASISLALGTKNIKTLQQMYDKGEQAIISCSQSLHFLFGTENDKQLFVIHIKQFFSTHNGQQYKLPPLPPSPISPKIQHRSHENNSPYAYNTHQMHQRLQPPNPSSYYSPNNNTPLMLSSKEQSLLKQMTNSIEDCQHMVEACVSARQGTIKPLKNTHI